MSKFLCPKCGEEIDKKFVFLEGATGKFGRVMKEDETQKYIIAEIATPSKKGYFAFRKDSPGYTRKWSFRLRNASRVLFKSYQDLDSLDKILYTSDGMRIGELANSYPQEVNAELVKLNLRGRKDE